LSGEIAPGNTLLPGELQNLLLLISIYFVLDQL